MKPSRDAVSLAASLTAAAAIPPRLPERATPEPANMSVAPAPTPEIHKPAASKPSRTQKIPPETVGITLRPERALLNRYTFAAADRTREEGRVISAQQIMLEVLERHAPKASQ